MSGSVAECLRRWFNPTAAKFRFFIASSLIKYSMHFFRYASIINIVFRRIRVLEFV